MSAFDALRAAELIVARAALSHAPSPTAGLRLPAPPAQRATITAKILSIQRGVVTVVDIEVGITRQLIAPPVIAIFLRRTAGIVRIEIDSRDHILSVYE